MAAALKAASEEAEAALQQEYDMAILIQMEIEAEAGTETKEKTDDWLNGLDELPSFASLEFGMPHNEVQTEDREWFDADEMGALLEHYFRDQMNVRSIVDIDGLQNEGATLEANLRSAIQQIRNQSTTDVAHVQNTILMALNLGNMHWVAMHINIEDLDNPIINYFDPLGSSIPSEVQQALHRVFTNEDLNVSEHTRILQQDGHNCGPWTLAILRHFVDSGTELPEAFDITKAREEYRQILDSRSLQSSPSLNPALKRQKTEIPSSTSLIQKFASVTEDYAHSRETGSSLSNPKNDTSQMSQNQLLPRFDSQTPDGFTYHNPPRSPSNAHHLDDSSQDSLPAHIQNPHATTEETSTNTPSNKPSPGF